MLVAGYGIGVLLLGGKLVPLDLYVYLLLICTIAGVASFGGISWLDHRFKGRWAPIGLFASLTCLFAIPILEVFRLKYTNGSTMFGFVSWSDAEAYIPGGWQMLVDGTLTEWHQRRPINASIMEVRLLLAGFDLRTLILMNAAMVAAATTYAALELKRQLGTITTALFILVVWGYIQPFIPTTLSAVLGLTLALVAIGALMRSVRLTSMWLYGVGVAVLSFALNARAGNYFVLPAVWLWGVIYLGRTWRERAIVAGFGGICLLSGFAYSLLLINVFGNGEVLTYNANFANTLYGLARGGIGYQSAEVEHPELFRLDAAVRAASLFRYSIQDIFAHPFRFIAVYFNDVAAAARNLVAGPDLLLLQYSMPATLKAFFNVLYAVGLLGIVRFAFDRRNALLLLALAGFATSVPFIWHDGGLRVLASTIPFILVIPAVGLQIFGVLFAGGGWAGIRRALNTEDPPNATNELSMMYAPTIVFAGVALAPFLLAGSFKSLATEIPNSEPTVACPQGQTPLNVDFHRLVYVMRIHPGDRLYPFSATETSVGELRSRLTGMHIQHLFRNMPAPYTVFGVIAGPRSDRKIYTIVWKGELKDIEKQSHLHLCLGEVAHDLSGYQGSIKLVPARNN